MKSSVSALVSAGLLAAAFTAVTRAGQAPPRSPADEQSVLRFRFMGPSVGNRIASVVGVPGDPSIYYAGAASGGIWKSTDGGRTFSPIFDNQPVMAIGSLALASSNVNTVWAGTGEPWAIRDVDVMGDGVYKSTDAGATWTHMGLDATGRIARIIVHPTDPDIVYVCAEGRLTGPQEERGVFKTTNGGQRWDRILFVNPNTGCSGLTMDPKDPNVLFAGTWEVVMRTWAELSGGPGSGVFVTRDGGATWKKVEHAGLPKPTLGKIDVAIAPTDSSRVYALIQTADQGSLWRSDDGGSSWKVVSWDRALIGRAGYYVRLGISTADPNEVLVANSSLHRSTDGGVTFTPSNGCGDCHDIWWDSKNADRFVLTHDAGMTITTDHLRTSSRVTLPIGQMYHVAVDNQIPYYIYSNMQDDGTMRGASDTPENAPNNATPPGGRGGRGRGGPATGSGRAGGEAPGGRGEGPPPGPGRSSGFPPDPLAFGPGGGFGGAAYGRGNAGAWEHNLGGCESGFTLPDLVDPNVVWASCYGNKLTRFDARMKTARSVAPWMISLDSPPNDAKYRCHWTAPLAIDPFDHNTVYYGCQVIFATSNGGQSWRAISPDLSTQDPKYIVSSGGIVGDNLGQFYGELVFAIAPSEIQKGLIWAGTNDGKIWNTRDGGARWNDLTKNVAGMPPWGTVTQIAPSHFDPGTAYIAVDFHLMDNREPFIYKTADFGQTWTKVTGNLPSTHPLDYVRSVAENPNRRGMLFAGTGHAFYYSLDDGARWTPLQAGLPAAPVSWIVVQKQFHDVVVSTYGRGLYILDDVTPLEQQATGAPTVQLVAPRSGYRFARSGRAQFNFTLGAAPADSIKVEILDVGGKAVRTMQGPGRAGLNRVFWDLRYDQPHYVELRTTPPENPYIWNEPRFKGRETRPVTHWGLAQAMVGPLAAPGKYAVRVTASGQSATQPFEVIKDPKIASSDADLAASTEMQIRIRDDITQTSDSINGIEVMRRTIEDDKKANAGKSEVLKILTEMDAKLQGVEDKLIERSALLSDDKYFQQAYKVYSNLIWLNGAVGTGAGDEAGGADYRPTDTQRVVLETIEKDLAAARGEYQRVMDNDVASFNKLAAGRNLKPLAPKPADAKP
jgi:photosystem II stability/assembly factor-like uncharacterized protein